jgi:hypothetical protein
MNGQNFEIACRTAYSHVYPAILSWKCRDVIRQIIPVTQIELRNGLRALLKTKISKAIFKGININCQTRLLNSHQRFILKDTCSPNISPIYQRVNNADRLGIPGAVSIDRVREELLSLRTCNNAPTAADVRQYFHLFHVFYLNHIISTLSKDARSLVIP